MTTFHEFCKQKKLEEANLGGSVQDATGGQAGWGSLFGRAAYGAANVGTASDLASGNVAGAAMGVATQMTKDMWQRMQNADLRTFASEFLNVQVPDEFVSMLSPQAIKQIGAALKNKYAQKVKENQGNTQAASQYFQQGGIEKVIVSYVRQAMGPMIATASAGSKLRR